MSFIFVNEKEKLKIKKKIKTKIKKKMFLSKFEIRKISNQKFFSSFTKNFEKLSTFFFIDTEKARFFNNKINLFSNFEFKNVTVFFLIFFLSFRRCYFKC